MASEARHKIMLAAAGVFITEGYDVPIRAILSRAGVSNSSFFHLFKTKLDLARALAADIAAGHHAAVIATLSGPDGAGRTGMEAAVATYLRWAEDERDLVMLRLALPSRSVLPDHCPPGQPAIEAVRLWAAPLTESGVIRPLPAALLHALMFGPADLIVRRWLENASADHPTAMAAPLADAAWKAMAADVVKKYREKVAIPTGKANTIPDQSALDL